MTTGTVLCLHTGNFPNTQLFIACPPPGDEHTQEEKVLRDENMHRRALEGKSRLKKKNLVSIAFLSFTYKESPELFAH